MLLLSSDVRSDAAFPAFRNEVLGVVGRVCADGRAGSHVGLHHLQRRFALASPIRFSHLQVLHQRVAVLGQGVLRERELCFLAATALSAEITKSIRRRSLRASVSIKGLFGTTPCRSTLTLKLSLLGPDT